MYVGKDYDPIDVGESDVFTIEFTPRLVSGETITALWTCVVLRTDDGAVVDASPAAHIIGTADVQVFGTPPNATTFTNQMIGTCVAGNTYRLVATATTSNGRTLLAWSHVYCRALE